MVCFANYEQQNCFTVRGKLIAFKLHAHVLLPNMKLITNNIEQSVQHSVYVFQHKGMNNYFLKFIFGSVHWKNTFACCDNDCVCSVWFGVLLITKKEGGFTI